jgi:hypothetical protein
VDAVYPFVDLGVDPIRLICSCANKSSEVTVSRRTLKMEFVEFREGRGRGINRGYENGFRGFWEITASGAELEKETLGLCNGWDGTDHSCIVGIPWLS